MATITGKADNSRYILTCEWSSTQNVSANTSTITAIVYLNGNGYTTSSSYWSCVINGTTVTSGKNASIGGKTELGRKTWTVSHASDGKCSTTISFSYSNGLSSAGTYTTKSGSGSGTVTLPTIPRGSTMTLSRSSATIGSDSITVNISRASNSFTHKVQLYFGNYSALLAEGVGTSYTFTPAMSLCNQIPNATSGTATIKIQTMNGSTWVAEASKTITFNVPSSVVPSVGISVTSNNALNGYNVASKTTFTVKATNASGSYGSTIKSYLITGGGLNSASSSATTKQLSSGSYTFTVKVTDSRGRTATATATKTVNGYSVPTISFSPYRADSSGNRTNDGTYVYTTFQWDITNVANANINSKQYALYKKAANETSWTTVKSWTELSAYNGSLTISFGNGFATSSSYEVRVAVKDNYNTITYDSKIGTISCLIDFEKDGIGIGKIREQGALDIRGQLHTTNGIYSGNSVFIKTDPNNNVRFGYEPSSTDTFIANTANDFLRLKADKTLTYAGYKVFTSYSIKQDNTDFGNKKLTNVQALQNRGYEYLAENTQGIVFLNGAGEDLRLGCYNTTYIRFYKQTVNHYSTLVALNDEVQTIRHSVSDEEYKSPYTREIIDTFLGTMPMACYGDGDIESVYEDTGDCIAVNTDKLIAALMQKNCQLEERVNDLEERLNKLEALLQA